MFEYLNEYLQTLYSGHKYAYALLVLLSTTVAGVSMEMLSGILTAGAGTYTDSK
jgi:hypothetical protein